MEAITPGVKLFTIADINKEIMNKDKVLYHRLLSKSTADQPYWQRSYLQSIFHNMAVKPKHPKIFRNLFKGVYQYSLYRIESQPYI